MIEISIQTRFEFFICALVGFAESTLHLIALGQWRPNWELPALSWATRRQTMRRRAKASSSTFNEANYQ